MPKKDPVTGCQVLTTAEFFQLEAELEGKGRTGADLQREFLEDQETEIAREAERYRDPAFLLEYLCAGINEWNDLADLGATVPQPLEILEVLESHVHFGFREGRVKLRVRARCEDGTEGILHFESREDAGSYLDPPDSEMNIFWE